MFEILNRFLSNCDEFVDDYLIVNVSIEICLGVLKLAELVRGVIVLGDLWKLEAFFLEDLLGVDFEDLDWVDSFLVDFGPLGHGVLVVAHIESSAEHVPLLIHMSDVSLELLLLLSLDLSQFLKGCLFLLLDFGKLDFILFLLLLFFVELFLELFLHLGDVEIRSWDWLSDLVLAVFVDNLETVLVASLGHQLFVRCVRFIL